MNTRMNRRSLLKSTGIAAAGLASAAYSPAVWGFAANETINVGCIGTGGRCRRLMSRLNEIPGVQITAVCDVWDHHLAEGKKLADEKAAMTKSYHEMLERKDVDAIVIGSPDHWHVPMTIDACEAGKDVYVEKPLTHDLDEGDRAIFAQRKTKRIVQVGTQQRSMPQCQEALKILESGELGEIYKVHLTWNRNSERFTRPKYNIDPKTVVWKDFLGNAPDQPFDEYRFRNWRWFWDFGGGIFTDLMVHWIDVAYWFLKLDNPSMAASIGDQFRSQGLWETPDTVQTLLRYPKQNVQCYFEGTFVNARNAAMIEFMGSEATLYIDRGRYEVIPERNSKATKRELIIGKAPRGSDFFDEVDGALMHLQNWVDCIRTRKTPNCPVEEGVRSAAAAHLANQSFRTGRVANWER